MRRIPDDAFQRYVDMGDERSYERLAESCGVTKRAVARLAKRDRWAERLAEHERTQREAADQRASESLAAMTARQLRILRSIEGKALAALRESGIASALDAVKAIELSFRQERLLAGHEQTERHPRPTLSCSRR